MKTKELIIALIVLVLGIVSTAIVLDMYLGNDKSYSFSIVPTEDIIPVSPKAENTKLSKSLNKKSHENVSLIPSPTRDNMLSSELNFSKGSLNVPVSSGLNTPRQVLRFYRSPDLVAESNYGTIMYAFGVGSRSENSGNASGVAGIMGNNLSSYVTTAFSASATNSTQPTILVDPMNDPLDYPSLPAGEGKYFLVVLAAGYLLFRIRRR